MTTWTSNELSRIGAAEELEIAPLPGSPPLKCVTKLALTWEARAETFASSLKLEPQS